MPKNATEYRGIRTYRWQDVKLPSVTTILGAYPKPWLASWAAKMVTEEVIFGNGEWRELPFEDALRHLKGTPWRKRDTAADFGSALHDALHALVHGQTITDTVPGAERHTAALVAWWQAYRPTPLDSERQVFNLADGYAGSLDLIADVYGRRLLIDLKTGSVVGPENRLQLAAYRYAEFLGEGDHWLGAVPEVDACAVLHIPREHPEEWQFIELPAGGAEYDTFLAVKRTFDYQRANEKTTAGEIILPQAIEVL